MRSVRSRRSVCYSVGMAQADPEIPKRQKPANAFEAFVQRIARVPKEKIDALDAAEREQRRPKRAASKPKRAT